MKTSWLASPALVLAGVMAAALVGCSREEVKPKSGNQATREASPAPQKPGTPIAVEKDREDLTALSDEDALAKVKALEKKFDDQMEEFRKKFQAAPAAERAKLRSELPQPDALVGQFQQLAESHPKSEAGAQSWIWIVQHVREGDAYENSLNSLLEHHPNNKDLKPVIMSMQYQPPASGIVKRFEQMLAKCTDRDLCGVVNYTYLQYRKRAAEIKALLTNDEESAKRYVQSFGQAQLDYLKAMDVLSEDELLAGLEKLNSDFGDVVIAADRTIGSVVEGDLFEVKFLKIGKEAPDIEGEDIEGTGFKLSDYRGKVVMLDFWGDW